MLRTLTWRLHRDLSDEVFDKTTKELIENCRVVCDLKALSTRIKDKGSVLVGLEDSNSFVMAVRKITDSVSSVEDAELVQMYRTFLTKFEKHIVKVKQ